MAAWTTLRYMLDVFSYYRRCSKRYGDPFLLPTVYGDLVVTGTPQGIASIFSAPPETFLVFGRQAVEPLFGPTGLQVTNGERHRRDRNLLMPHFHGGRMRAYGRLIVETTRKFISQHPHGQVFRMQDVTHAISLDVMIRAIFGITDPQRAARLRQAIMETHHASSPLLILFRFLRRDFGGVGPWVKFRKSLLRLEKLAYEQIEARRAEPLGEDILNQLLTAGGFTTSELRDEMLSLMTAGHETTAISAAWGMYWIHQNPHVLERLLGEMDALGPNPCLDAIETNAHLEAVCNETLRLHPVIPEVTRLLDRPFDLAGYKLEPGFGVAAVAALAHMREETFPEPNEFRPERFLKRKYSPYEFLPFGGGARRCLGAAFAMYEMKLVLATLIREYEFRLASGEPERPFRRNVVIAPRHGVRMVILRKR